MNDKQEKFMSWMQSPSKFPICAILSALVFFAFLLRFLALQVNPLLSRDGIAYLEFSETWFSDGDAFIEGILRKPPLLFQYLVVSLMRCGMTAQTAGIAINLVVGSLTVIPVYFSGRAVFHEKEAGVVCAILAAVLPPLVDFSISPMRDSLYLFFAAWTLFALFHVLNVENPWHAFFCGATSIFAMQCRFEAFELPILCGAGLFFFFLLYMRSMKKALSALLSFVAGGMAALAFFEILPGYPSVFGAYLQRLEYTGNLFRIILFLK